MVTLLLAVLVQDPAGVMGSPGDDVPEEVIGGRLLDLRGNGINGALFWTWGATPWAGYVDEYETRNSINESLERELTATERERAKGWMSTLADEDISVREEAEEALRSLGDGFRRLARELLAGVRDPEVRARLQELLKRR